ncbi:aminoglycoside phosphotransferase family protein [Aliikangiella marina]|uniref:Aminoglycoside phosphotransferase family protein n=1 Tax=Aliikangiella marina TaxID=1712262 RepID=A0A545TCZ9_9GAMM|nr:aminoglycoside phosphotransferase family protein [Aliikangiella marina]TQV75095.1 aminoglycoside phosphotransferase family protein [Aliikangiella marina]
MNNNLLKDWDKVSQSFAIKASLDEVITINSGLINDSFRVQDGHQSFILQRLNTQVFTQPFAIQENFDRVSIHLMQSGYPYSGLQSVKTLNGDSIIEINNRLWRMMPFIENSITLEKIESPEQAHDAAKMIGLFDLHLGDLNPDDFHTTIPDFHNLSKRLERFKKVLRVDLLNRRRFCAREIELIERFTWLGEWQSSNLANGNLRIKVTHNDTKITNQLFDRQTKKPKALIDWDTIMPGCWLYDYADMVRSFTPSSREDSNDLKHQYLDTEIFKATSQGYLNATHTHLSEFEKSHMVTAVQLIYYMLGIRFLTDFLEGDNYFKTDYEDHNLIRCRNQFNYLEQLSKDLSYWQALAKEA